MKYYNLNKNPIGAWVDCYDKENKNKFNAYCSFGKLICNHEGMWTDTFGELDDEIYHYFENLEDLKYYAKNKNKSFPADIKVYVRAYELVFSDKSWKDIKELRKALKQ